VYIVNASRYHLTKGCYTGSAFYRAESRSSSQDRRLKNRIHNPNYRPNVCILPRARILHGIQSGRKGVGSRTHTDGSHRDHVSLYRTKPWYSPHSTSRVRGVYMSGQTSIESMMTHTVVFAVVFALLRRQFPQFY